MEHDGGGGYGKQKNQNPLVLGTLVSLKGVIWQRVIIRSDALACERREGSKVLKTDGGQKFITQNRKTVYDLVFRLWKRPPSGTCIEK